MMTKFPSEHACMIDGCWHAGTMKTGSGYRCRFHQGVQPRHVATVNARINGQVFTSIFRTAVALSNRAPGESVKSDVGPWLKEKSPDIAAFAAGNAPKTCRKAAGWLLSALDAYAHAGLEKTRSGPEIASLQDQVSMGIDDDKFKL